MALDWNQQLAQSAWWLLRAFGISAALLAALAWVLSRTTGWGRKFGRLAWPYLNPARDWRPLATVALLLLLAMFAVRMTVLFSYWYNGFYSALQSLDAAFPAAAPFTFDNTRVIAVGISNGGGAVLRAAELDGDWLDAVVAGEPNVFVEGARPLYDYTTQAALLMPCALLHLQNLPQPPLTAQSVPLWTQRCAALKAARSCRPEHDGAGSGRNACCRSAIAPAEQTLPVPASRPGQSCRAARVCAAGRCQQRGHARHWLHRHQEDRQCPRAQPHKAPPARIGSSLGA